MPAVEQAAEPMWLGETRFAGFGWICVAVTQRGLARLSMLTDPAIFHKRWQSRAVTTPDCPSGLVSIALRQLDEYLAGQRTTFELPIDWTEMEPFQKSVLAETAGIPFGQVRTYGQVTRAIGQVPGAARAVGGALAANPIGIVIPCHRVIGQDRRLHGFAAPGGIHTKAWLLELEGHTLVADRLMDGAMKELFA
jgi:methylated-DNA-[protein]-cysteine S-methyltransferase